MLLRLKETVRERVRQRSGDRQGERVASFLYRRFVPHHIVSPDQAWIVHWDLRQSWKRIKIVRNDEGERGRRYDLQRAHTEEKGEEMLKGECQVEPGG